MALDQLTGPVDALELARIVSLVGGKEAPRGSRLLQPAAHEHLGDQRLHPELAHEPVDRLEGRGRDFEIDLVHPPKLGGRADGTG